MNYFHEIRGRKWRHPVFENDGTWHVISGRRYALRPHVPLDPEKCRLMLGLLNGANSAKQNKRLRRKLLTLALTLALGMIAPNFTKPAQAAEYTAACNAGVGDTADLIAKIAAANLAGGQNTINLGINCVYDITDVDNNYYGPTGLPAIISDLTIEGNGAKIQRSGVNKIRFFYVGKEGTGSFPSPAPGTLTLRNLTLSGGYQMGGSGGGGGAGMGGAIFNHGTLKLEGVTLQGNYANGGNGGKYSSPGGGLGGAYSAENDICGGYIDGEYIATGFGCPGDPGFGGGGGSVYNGGSGGFGGGGGNSYGSGGFGGGSGGFGAYGGGGAGLGGAVFNHLGTVNITNSTFTDNTATGGMGNDAYGGSGYGAALFNLNGTVTIINSTISGNTVTAGIGSAGNGSATGAVYNLGYDDSSGDTSAAMTLINTIIANTTGGDDLVNEGNPGITTATVDATNNAPNIVVNKLNGGGSFEASFLANLNNADPMLSALADNGGLTWTMALQNGSPAINNGTNIGTPAYDQRGFSRAGNIDIGAYEDGGKPIVTVINSGTGGGNVTGTNSYDCDSTYPCTNIYDFDTQVILTAIPAAGSIFTGWSGEGCKGTGTCTVTMDQARSVTAHFTPLSQWQGNAIHFDGVDDYVNLNASAAWNLRTASGFTLEAWIKPEDLTYGQAIFQNGLCDGGSASVALTIGTGSGGYEWHNGTPGKIKFLFEKAYDVFGGSVTQNSSLIQGQWTHVAVTFDNSVLKLYINGVFDASAATTGTPSLSSWAFLGADPGCGYRYPYKGALDEIRIWDSALSVSDIANRMSGRLTGSEAGLVAYYPMDQGTAFGNNDDPPVSTVNDITTGEQNGTLQNFALSGWTSNWIEGVSSFLGVNKTGTGSGTITSPDTFINCGAACSYSYDIGTTITLTASPGEGTTFTGWTGCDSVNGLDCNVSMDNDRTVTADFSLTALTAGLVSLWKGEGNAKDSFGSNHGTLNNGATYTTGKIGQSFSFDGIDDLVQINSTGIFKGQSEATIEAWVRPKGAHSDDEGFGGQVYAENTGSSDWTRFGIYVFNDGSVHGFGRPGESGAYFDAISTANIPLNQWSHLAATWKADEGVRVYINGTLQGSVNAAVGAFTGTDSSLMSIGAGGINAGSPKYVFNGDIDGLGIYTRALSASEVLTNYYKANGLVAEWKGDGNAYDSVGNNHGTLENGATTVPGKVGNALSFDGVNDYVTVPSLTWQPTAFTIDFWINPASRANYTQQIRAAGGWGQFVFHTTSDGSLYVGTDIDSRFTPAELPADTLVLNQWQHFAYAFDNGTAWFYKNGALLATKPQALPAQWAGFMLGGMTSDSRLNGLVDEVQIYNRALSAGEITAIYSSGLNTDIVSSVSSGNGEITCDESYNCTITPEAGYHIVDVLVDGEAAGPISSYQFDNDGLTHTIEAIFAEGLFALLPNTMTVGRGGHTQTLLNDGKVLIAGGFTGSAPYMPTATAELYDPVAKTFTATGSMSTPRSGHTATLLQDGRVLIAGGSGCSAGDDTCAYLNTIEIYSPAEGTFSFVRNMFSGRSDHTATLLQDGKVLIAGGVSGIAGWVGTFLNDAEIYDPSNDTLTHLENALNGNRAVHTATLLNNGTVLIAGGRTTSGETYLNSTLIFDHSDDTFSVGSNMKQQRVYHDAVLMNDGRVLFLGGYLGGASSSAEVFNPSGNAFDWTSNNMPIGRRSPTAVVLANGKVLVVGGSDGNGWNGGREYSDIYNPVTNTFINGGKMSFARVAPVTLLSDGSVLAAGGFPLSWGQPIYDTAEIYNGYDSFSLTVNSPANGTISCGPTNVLRGNSRDCVIAAGSGYFLSSLTDNGVSVIGAVSGNIYSIANITANHDINAVFSLPPVNGVCGTVSGQTLTAAPALNLCNAGTPASVSGSGPWTWTCQGQNSGTNASCSANIQTYTVTFSAGSGGGISPNTPQTVNYGSVPSFTITPDTGYSVSSVNGCGVLPSGSSYIAAPITADCTITVIFTPNPVNGLCGASNGQTLTAAPASNLCSAGTPASVSGSGPWTWTCQGQNSGTNASCSANIQTYALSVNTSGTGSGTVTGAGIYNHGQTVTVGATADASSVFSGWSGDCSGTGNPTTVIVNGTKTCTAAFTLKTYTVTTGAGPNGKITCTPATVNHGSSSICTITPDADYQVEDIEVDAVSVGKAATYSMSNITSDCTVTASFSIKKYDLSITKTGSGSVTVSPPGGSCGTDCFTYNKNQRVTVSAKAEKDHIFTGWTGACSGTGICQLAMSAEKSVTANFEAAAPVISVAPDGPQDFGNVRVGRLKTKTLKITNNGTGNLRITSIEIDGADSDTFSKRSGTAIIKPGKSSNIRVTFKPKSGGTQSGTLRINSNDPVTPVVEIILTGTGTLKR